MCLAWEPEELLFKHNNKKGLMFINNIRDLIKDLWDESDTVIDF